MIDPELLKYYREKEGLTIKELSKKVKCSKKTVELWEKGELVPTLSNIEQLCSIYKIVEEDLYKEGKTNFGFVIISIILIIMGLVLGYIKGSITIIVLLPTMLFSVYNLGRVILKEYRVTIKVEDLPKSVFGLNLDIKYLDEREKKYLLESNFISSIYILFNMICKLIGLDDLVLNINLLENYDLNQLFVMVVVYVVLMIIMFIIEYLIGEKMVKKQKDNE